MVYRNQVKNERVVSIKAAIVIAECSEFGQISKRFAGLYGNFAGFDKKLMKFLLCALMGFHKQTFTAMLECSEIQHNTFCWRLHGSARPED